MSNQTTNQVVSQRTRAALAAQQQASSSSEETNFEFYSPTSPIPATQEPPNVPILLAQDTTQQRLHSAMNRAQNGHRARLEQISATISRAQQLQTAAASIRMTIETALSESDRNSRQLTTSNAPVLNQFTTRRSRALNMSARSRNESFNNQVSSENPRMLFSWTGNETRTQPIEDGTNTIENSESGFRLTDPRSLLQQARASNVPMNFLGQRNARPRIGTVNPSIHPQFRSKIVVKIHCNHCETEICRRGMKAILLGNTKVELYSTDTPPTGVSLVYADYTTQNCQCRIRDGACLGCGNVVGYHVTQPCDVCLEACNNGHFWMFHADGVSSVERLDECGSKSMRWASLPVPEEDEAIPKSMMVANSLCR